MILLYVTSVVVIIITILFLIVLREKRPKNDSKVSKQNLEREKQDSKKAIPEKPQKISSKIEKESKVYQKKSRPSHQSFLKSFKGFKDKITDFDVSSDGKFVVASSLDRQVRIFYSKSLDDKDPVNIIQRIDFNDPTRISISNDGTKIAVGMCSERKVELYTLTYVSDSENESKSIIKLHQLSKSEDGLLKTDLNHLILDPKGRYFLIGSGETDTNVKIWSFGQNQGLLKTINTNQLNNNEITRSEDGRFFGIAAWTSDVNIFEVKFDKAGVFKEATKAMTLKGHRKGVLHITFGSNSRVATLSKDGTIKLWAIDVRYDQGEDPHCLETLNYLENQDFKVLGDISCFHLYDFNQSRILALAHKNTISIYDWLNHRFVDHIHLEVEFISKILIKDIGSKPYLYTSSSDSRIHMWKILI